MFDLGQAKYQFYSPRDSDSIRACIAGCDTVINLVGKHYETKRLTQKEGFPFVDYQTNYSFEEAHVEVPERIATIAREEGVEQFIHVSSVAAKEDSPSHWARSKWQGEQAVTAAFGKATTLVKTSQTFGPEDKLLNWFAIAARAMPFVPLPNEGEALTKPVYMGDVAKGIGMMVGQKGTRGKTYVFEGKDDYTIGE